VPLPQSEPVATTVFGSTIFVSYVYFVYNIIIIIILTVSQEALVGQLFWYGEHVDATEPKKFSFC